MKIWLGGKASANSGGMYRVYEGLYQHLPENDIEIVPNKEDADVLNPHIGMWGNFPADKPIVISSHGMLWEEHGWGRIANKVNKECLTSYRRADVVTAPSNFVARTIARYTGASPVVAHHGIDTDEWLPSAITKGYVLWNKARTDSASDPKEMGKLAELAEDTMFYSTHGHETDNIFIFGQLSPNDMYEMVSQAGVYLALSKESGGPCFGVLEAMSCAVPVLSWDFGGTAETIKHKETGYLAEPGNYEDLLLGLRYCIEHHARLGQSARQNVIDKYQWKNVIQEYIAAYELALRGYNDKVSVIIPCHNLEKFLPGCLDSVLEQDYPNFEVIIVNDASTDNSWDIAYEYSKKDSRVYVINFNTNQHVSFARNTGIEISASQFILPLDADDRLYPGAISALVRELQSNRTIDIVSGKLHIYHEDDLEGNYHVSGWPNNTSLKLQLEGFNRLPYSSMYRYKVFERAGGYRTRIRNGTEDADFWTRALALGYQAKILDIPTLKYTHRINSLGKQNDKGSSVWLNWFPWTEETSPARETKLKNFSPPKVSIIVPVGPGHRKHIKACVDSVIAQSEEDWEIIVINDTRKKFESKDVYGLGFVRFVEYEGNKGVAYARNRGIEVALADKIVFLDVDDTLQPHALSALLAAQEYVGGWIYGDWYINQDAGGYEYSEADSWDYSLILNRSLSPITGIYEKEHVELVNGFTEDIPGWEDWDFHLKLLHHGICGTRLKTPLITYNMHLGWRREDNFKDKDNLLKYIREKHYNVLKDNTMGCSNCGGGRTLVVKQNTTSTGESNMENTVLLQYLGNEAGRNRIKSKAHPSTHYTFSTNKRLIRVFQSDVEYFMSLRKSGSAEGLFEKVKENPSPTSTDITVKEEPLISEEIPTEYRALRQIEELGFEEHILQKLNRGGFIFIIDLKKASDAELLAVKGIGAQRVTEIREAVTLWESSN